MSNTTSSDAIILSAVGDVMLGDLPASSAFGVGSMIRKHGPRFPFELCKSAFDGSDIICGNLEVVLSRFDWKNDHFDSVHLRAQPEALEGLKWVGFNVMTLANNHIMQHGRRALLETITLLRDNGIAYTGIQDQSVNIENFVSVEKRGAKIGFMGYNFRPPQYFVDPPMDVQGSRERILSDIESYRGKVDYLILSVHWGEEFVDFPSADQVKLGREFIDAGASVILGHHPHILQGIEVYKGRVIAYSLGDFVFDLWDPRLRSSMILRFSLRQPDKIEYEPIPVYINRRWQPELLRDEKRKAALAEIQRLSGIINERLADDDYDREVREQLRQFRGSVYLYYLKNVHRYGLRGITGNLSGIIRRRIKRS